MNVPESDFEILSYRSEVKNFHTLVDVLRYRASRQPGETACWYLHEDEEGDYHRSAITYGELEVSAMAAAAALQSAAGKGDRALLVYPPGLDYLGAFFGCLYAGVIAVPVYPPNLTRVELSMQRLDAIMQNAKPCAVLTTSDFLPHIEPVFSGKYRMKKSSCIATDVLARGGSGWNDPDIAPYDVAFLQYTSGSTGLPKGVMISHVNVLTNLLVLSRSFGFSRNYTCGVTWLPQYHDMGLIGGILLPIWSGHPFTLISPLTFLYDPYIWLKEISDTRASVTGGPNFAYDHVCRRVTAEQKKGLDLSGWHVALNGAEPILTETMERFYQSFRECGFRRETFLPSYGLAEATLMVTCGAVNRAPMVRSVVEEELMRNRVVLADSETGAVNIVGCGSPVPGHEVIIVDPDTLTKCPEDRIGEIWIAGPCVTRGYWDSPEANKETFMAHLSDTGGGPYLRTGDLGFMVDNELFVTGRIKDVLIIRGQNYYPHDIERTVQACHPALRKGCGAAFSVEDEGAAGLVIVQEIKQSQMNRLNADEVIQRIRKAVGGTYELYPDAVVLVESGQVLKTSSGKLQRFACRESFLRGDFREIARWAGKGTAY
ncbi:MAG: fatty acyl-AMP ligase [Spirochaetes bacterium]|nr:fatty acyl-AMP ligase [Spirochaetota bacterium]